MTRRLIVQRPWDAAVSGNQGPVARLISPSTGLVGQLFTVDASTSSDADGVIRKWAVTWGDGAKSTFPGPPGQAEHIYTAAATYVLRLTVWDNQKSDTAAAVTVTIAPVQVEDDPDVDPVDCVVSDWAFSSAGSWRTCQEDDTQTRDEIWTRTVVTAPTEGGASCGPLSEVRTGEQACVYVPPAEPVDCELSAWALESFGAWGACSPAGEQTRPEVWSRTIVTQPSNGGAACAHLTEARIGEQACDPPADPVPVDCVLSAFALQAFGAWGSCQPNSQQSRQETWARTVVTPASNGGAACGSLTEQRVGTRACTYVPPPSPVNCVLSSWAMSSASAWGGCQSNSTRTRTEQWVRTVVTPASGGGTPCGPLSETRIGSQACVYVPPDDPPPGGSSHAYFDALTARPDRIASYSLRSQAQIQQYKKGGTGAQGAINYIYPSDPDPRKQDAVKIVTGAGDVSLSPHTLRLPIPAYGDDSLLVTWESWLGAEFSYANTGIQRYKHFQFDSPRDRIWTEMRSVFINAPSGAVATVDVRSYGQLGYELGPNVTWSTPLTPQANAFSIPPETWTRYWAFFDPAGEWYEFSLWVAHETQAAVRVHDRRQIKPNLVGGAGGGSSSDRWETFWLEYNTSSAPTPRATESLVAYCRNVVMLKNISDPTPLLVRPVG